MRLKQSSMSFLVILVAASIAQASAQTGVDHGGGGDHQSLLRYGNASPRLGGSASVDPGLFKSSFRARAQEGLAQLFDSNVIHRSDFDRAMETLDAITAGEDWRFDLDVDLRDVGTGRPRTAENFRDGRVVLNPVEWRLMEILYRGEVAILLQRAIAAHEILSLPPLGLESTDHYPFSSTLLNSFSGEDRTAIYKLRDVQALSVAIDDFRKSMKAAQAGSVESMFLRAMVLRLTGFLIQVGDDVDRRLVSEIKQVISMWGH